MKKIALRRAVERARAEKEKGLLLITDEIAPRDDDDDPADNTREAVNLCAILGRYRQDLSVESIVTAVDRLAALARRSHVIAEKACNRELTRGEERADAEIDKEIKDIAADLGIERAWTQGDPRGYALRLIVRDDTGRAISNNWDGEDFGL